MTPRTQNIVNAVTLCLCALTFTGWTGSLPAGTGTVALVSLGLFGLALFPDIAPMDNDDAPGVSDDSSADPAA